MDSEAFEELAGYYGPGSVTWRVGREAVLLVGGGRAVLMQLAHPLVAAGVSQHSSYEQDPTGRFRRTFTLGQTLAFGTRSEARKAAQTINQRHKPVEGTLHAAAGDFAAGAPYHARDPDLLLWVHATLIESILHVYQLLVAPLAPAEQERYYQESFASVRLLGLPPAHLPQNFAAFTDYMQMMLASNNLAVTPEAKTLANLVIRPRAPLPTRPLFEATANITIGLLPPRLREMYGYHWNAGQQFLFDAWVRSTRRMLPLLPGWLREFPRARAAEARVHHALAETA
ncbi:MAG TPA: oxygenase MpaB family protein [Ktedonobacterales bacterium]